MVLVNGLKYACERCIRGHRVTTCTHTNEPLILIKPKGRPSTQCPHCKEQRQKKNLHIKCTCSKHDHDSSCPCYVTGKCTCQAKPRKSKENKEKDKEKDKDLKDLKNGSISSIGSNQSSIPTKSPPSEIPNPVSRNKLENLNSNDLFNNKDDSSQLITANEFFLENSIKSWDMDSASDLSNNIKRESLSSINSMSSINHGSDLHLNMPVSLTMPLRDNPPSISTKDKYSYFQNQNQNQNHQVGMYPLQKFKAVTPSSETSSKKRLGEITIPMNEYIAPMNSMNNNLNNLLISVGSPPTPDELSAAAAANALRAQDENTLKKNNELNNNSSGYLNQRNGSFPLIDSQLNSSSSSQSNNNNNNANNEYGSRYSTSLVDDTFGDIVIPMAGNGLLDLFDTNNNGGNNNNYSGTSIGANNSNNLSNGGINNLYKKSYNLSNASISSTDSPGPEGYFPLHALIGPKENTSNTNINNSNANNNNGSSSLSYSNLNNHNGHSSKPLSRTYTGGSNYSNYSSHSLHSANHGHGHGHGHSHGHHGHGHGHGHGHNNSHFSPYPNPMTHSHSHHSVHSQSQSQLRRSNSFLSISSAESIESLNSSNFSTSNLHSPPTDLANNPINLKQQQNNSDNQNPQSLTIDDDENIVKLTNAKTNTTLMDDIYQTKTYTEDNELKKLKSRAQSNYFNDDDMSLLSPDSINNQNILRLQKQDLNSNYSSSNSPNSLQNQNPTQTQTQLNTSLNTATIKYEDDAVDKLDAFLTYDDNNNDNNGLSSVQVSNASSQQSDFNIAPFDPFPQTNSPLNEYTNNNATHANNNNNNNNNNNVNNTNVNSIPNSNSTSNSNSFANNLLTNNPVNFDDFNSFIDLQQDNNIQ